MTEQMIDPKMSQAQMRLLQQHHQFAMQVWDPAQVNRATPHPHYLARRRADGSDLVKHVLGTLAVLGALLMMAKA